MRVLPARQVEPSVEGRGGGSTGWVRTGTRERCAVMHIPVLSRAVNEYQCQRE
jgi:hypothetical protein